ncbi:MAG: hypothetical protein AAGH19_05585 [Pseudomonadota bacterium]
MHKLADDFLCHRLILPSVLHIRRNLILLPVLACAMAAQGTTTKACGLHDPTLFARGMMNFIYPESLHVIGATQSAQRSGELPEPRRPLRLEEGSQAYATDSATRQKRAFERSVNALYALGLEIDERRSADNTSGIAIVVLNSMMWTRYAPEYTDVQQGLHVRGPEADDIVLVTDQVVVEAIRDGLLTVDRAVKLGVIKPYRQKQEDAALLAQIGSIGAHPLADTALSIDRFDAATSTWGPIDPLRSTD